MTPLQAQIVATERDYHAAKVNLSHALEDHDRERIKTTSARVVHFLGQLEQLRARERAL